MASSAPGTRTDTQPRPRSYGRGYVLPWLPSIRGFTQPADLELKWTRWENNELFVRTIRVG